MGFRCELCAELVPGGTWVDVGCGLAHVCHACWAGVVGASVSRGAALVPVAESESHRRQRQASGGHHIATGQES
jgi:hypothetical protein